MCRPNRKVTCRCVCVCIYFVYISYFLYLYNARLFRLLKQKAASLSFQQGTAVVAAVVRRMPCVHPQLGNRRLLYILFVTALW